jgi:hypothetical protein
MFKNPKKILAGFILLGVLHFFASMLAPYTDLKQVLIALGVIFGAIAFVWALYVFLE